MPERRSPLYDIHSRSAKMVKGGGDFMFPLSYTSPLEEHVNTRTNVGMQDLSSMGEIDIKGPGAERLLNRLLVNDIRDMEPGQLRYSTLCREDGGIVDDTTIYKFDDDHFMVVTSSGPRKTTARWIVDHAVGTSAYVTDVTAGIALPVIQGPRSRDFLHSVLEECDLPSLRFFRFTRARINETEVLVSRSGYTGELGYELYTPAEEAAVVWEYLFDKGRQYGLLPYGTAAMQSLRIEKGYPLYGVDIHQDVTPFHVGLDRWIVFRKREFIGRDSLLALQERGLQERWVGLILTGDKPANVKDKIYSVADIASYLERKDIGPEAGAFEDEYAAGSQPIGHITASAKGHTVGKMLAMAYVKTTHAWPGSRMLVVTDGRPTPATVTTTPFFDPENARLRG